MHETADAVIIGGGAIGCSVAFNLALRGAGKVVLLEKRFLTSGSTGRCAAGVRQQWGTEINCLLSRGSSQFFSQFKEKVGAKEDIVFRQSGYLMLAHTEGEACQLEENARLQRSLNIPVQVLDCQDILKIVPFLNREAFTMGTFCQEDGFMDPFKVTMGFARAARRMGAHIRTFTEIARINTRNGRITGVDTVKGSIDTPVVINATGPYASLVGRLAGLEHPVKPERHQIFVSEQVANMLAPMVISFYHKSYCQQSPDGSFLMGYGDPDEPAGVNYRASLEFLEEMARRAVDLMPVLGGLRLVRHWAGHYGISPDGQPIVGESDALKGYFLALGCGKGFMLSPMIGEIISQLVLGEETAFPTEILSEQRFERGDLILEPAVV